MGSHKGAQDLFCDPDFPVEKINLPDSAKEKLHAWLRPSDIREEPQMFQSGSSRFDILQGNVSDGWFSAACVAIADHPELIKQVVPEGQKLYGKGKGYDGSVTFRFWHLGRWETVRIDDRLPVNEYREPIAGRCKSRDEYWFPLLEKAYAKIHGGYTALETFGITTEGFVSLTGFSIESCTITDTDTLQDMFCHLRNEWKNGSLLLCTLFGGDLSAKQTGIYCGERYTITGIETVKTKSGNVRLVRVRCPYGVRGYEWTGPWSDEDKIWKEQTDAVKKQLQYKVQDNGESWMKFSHFMQLFGEIFVARRVPAVDFVQEILEDCGCNDCQQVEGVWEPRGPLQNFVSFATNQQFLIVAEEADLLTPSGTIGYEESCRLDTCNVFIELMQDHKRQISSPGKEYIPPEIGLYIFKRKTEKRMSVAEVEDSNQEAMVPFTRATAIHLRLEMEPKVPYIIVAGPRRIKLKQNFFLRVFSRKPCIRFQTL